MSFQPIIDNSESISINTRPLVASTTTRSGITRATSRGSQPWVFEVKLPDGPRWVDYRAIISDAESLDRHTTGTIQFDNTGHDWMFYYQGDLNPSTQTSSWTKGESSVQVSGGGTSGYRVRKGDFIQLKPGGYVYKVTNDALWSTNTVNLHRPILDDSGSSVPRFGQYVTFTVRCIEFPNWTIFARNQVGWSGAFIFVEEIT